MNNSSQKKREVWADYVKCFAILLMVMCHFNLSNPKMCQFIWIFHMPVFFFISGYFDKGRDFNLDVVKKSFCNLMIPYFFFSLISLSVCWVSPYLHPELYFNITIPQSFLNAIIGTLLMDDFVRPYAFMPCLAAWFLVALFLIKVYFSILYKCWTNYKYAIPFIISVPFVIIFYDVPFFSLDSASLGLGFYIAGFMFKKLYLIRYLEKKFISFLTCVTCASYLWFIGMKNGIINIDGGVWGECIIMFYLNGIIGTIFCISLAKLLPETMTYVAKIGRSTLTILGTHGMVGIVGKILVIGVLCIESNHFPFWITLLLSIFALIAGTYIHQLLLNYIPIAVGKTTKVLRH